MEDTLQSRNAIDPVNDRVREHEARERQQADDAVRRSERHLRDFVENAAMGLHWVSPDGIILWANKTEFDLLGYSREEYVGHHIAEFHVDRPVIEDILVRLTGGETLVDHAARMRCKDGSIRFVAINSNTLVENGQVVHTRCFTRDVTERLVAEHTLRESEAFNRSIVESSRDCIKVLDLAGNLLSMRSGQALLGIEDIQPFLNTSWIEFWSDDADRMAARAAVAAARAGGHGNFVGFFRTLRGEAKWWDVMISPILDAHGQPARLLAVSRDVTDRRQAELNAEFLAAISHDLVRCTGIDEMMETVGPNIGAHLDLSLCAFVEIDETAAQVVINHDWHRPDVPSLVGVHRLADFVEAEFLRLARAGEIIVVRDTAADARTTPEKFAALNIASFICVPLIRDGQWRFALCLYRAETSAWRTDEIELARELTVRIWTRLERLRAEDALRQSEARFRLMADSAPVLIWLSGTDRLRSWFNQTWLDYTGRSMQQEMGNGWADHLHPADRDRCLQTFTATLEARAPLSIEYRLKRHDGDYRWFLDIGVPRYTAAHEFSGYIGSCTDITEVKQAEAAMRESEARYRTLFELGPVAVYSIDTSGVIQHFNNHAAEMWGRTPAIGDTDERFCGSHKLFRADGSFMPHDQTPMAEVVAGKIPAVHDTEVLIERPDGSRVTVIVNIHPLTNERGEITGAINCFYDITGRKRAENALRESEERYHTLFDAIDEGFCIIESIFDEHNKPIDYRFLEVNPTFTKQTGLREPLGKRMRELVPEIEHHWIEIYGNVALTGEPIRFVNEAKAMDGRWFDVYACRVGEPEHRRVAIIFNDITARRHSEETLRQTHAALQAHAVELGRFNRIAVGRELRMIELKKEANALCAHIGQPARYPLEFEQDT